METRRSLLHAIAGVTVATAGCSRRAETNTVPPLDLASYDSAQHWPMRGRDAGNTGRNDAARLPAAPQYDELTTADRSSAGPFAVVGRTVYTPGEAIDRRNGGVAWTWDAGSQAAATPAVAHGHVFATEPGRTVSIDRETEEVRWTFDAGHAETSPAVLDTAVFVATDQRDRSVVALDADDGETLWRYPGEFGAVEGLAADESSVYVTGADLDDRSRLTAIDVETGAMRWSETLAGEIYLAPVVGDDEVYVGTTTGDLSSFDASGNERWRRSVLQTPQGFVTSRPALGDESVFVPANNGHASFAVDRQTGDRRWERATGTTYGAPAVGDELVHVGTSNEGVLALDPDDGSVEWSVETPRVASDVVLLESSLYVPHGGGSIGVLH